MNLLHRWYCGSGIWGRALRRRLIPWVLADVDLGDNVLEIGPGPGLTTNRLRTRVPRLTSLEIDGRLAGDLARRLKGTNVTVVEGDATRMPFGDGIFTAAVSFTMLHHVPSVQLQDRLLGETFRVLRPGAVFVGSDSTPNLVWDLAHLFDTRVPVDPRTFAGRLQAAGFAGAELERVRDHFRFRARKPA